MTEKRYAIVRVDGTCPIHTERLSSQEIDGMFNCSYDNCKNCRYGDTKEQLIRKVQTALQLCDKNRVEKCNQFYLVANEIVKFLGVK